MRMQSFIRLVALLLIPAMLISNPMFAAPKPLDAGAVKAKIQARGVGQGVRVILADKSEVSGTILTIAEENFTLKLKKTAEPQTIEYAQVASVHKPKMTGGKKALIALGIVAGVIVVPVVVYAIAIETH